MKIIHTADIHLGVKSQLNGERLRVKISNSFTHLCDKTIEVGTELLLIAGDLFDTPRISTKTIAKVKREFDRLNDTSCQVVILPGTHDPYDEKSIYRYVELPSNVHIITEDNPFVLLRDESIFITGKPYTRKQFGEDALEGLKVHPDADVNIALVHASLLRGDIKADSMVFNQGDLKKSGFDYIALGHWHNYQVISEDPPAIYPGSLEPLEMSHTHTGNVVLLEVSPAGIKYKPTKIGSLKVVNLDILVDEKMEPEDIYQEIMKYEGEDIILNVRVSGTAPENFVLDIQEIHDSFDESFHLLKIDAGELNQHIVLRESGVSERTVLGRFITKAEDKLSSAQDEEEREFWEDVIEEGIKRLYVPEPIVSSESGLSEEVKNTEDEKPLKK